MADKLALVVGINNYPDRPLDYCVNDAQFIAEVLSQPEYNYEVSQLQDEDATAQAIKAKLAELGDDSPDQLLFYFAGHGTRTPLGTFLVTVDGAPFAEGIELSELARLLEHVGSQGTTTVVLLDCCHSGAAKPWTNYGERMENETINATLAAATHSRVVLAACRPEQFSFEEEKYGHGIFTHHLLNGLAGFAADREGRITATSLYEYILEPFRAVTNQHPLLAADIDGTVALGEGFTPLTRTPATSDVRNRLTEEAARYIDSYRTRSVATHKAWLTTGHQQACQALEPILRWFETTLDTYPELVHHEPFRDLHQAALAQLASLGSVGPGTHLRQGAIREHLGTGAFGSVWKVDTASGDTIAYKVYRPQDLHIESKLDRFFRGFRAMQQLDHPRIVTVFDYTTCPVGFTMEYIEGPNLRDFAPRDNLDGAGMVRLMLAVAEVVRFAHNQASNPDGVVVHRDIKPENILVSYDSSTSTWQPYLTDFDLAWFATATALTRTAMGNPYYAAPEQLERPNSAVARAKAVDAFSFGQLLFFVFTGRDPVVTRLDENEGALGRELPNYVSEAAAGRIVALYRQLTATDPEERPSFVEVVGQLSRASQDLKELESGRLSSERVLIEVAYLLVGLEVERAEREVSFVSFSGRTRVTLAAPSPYAEEGEVLQLQAHLVPQTATYVAASSNEEARRILNRRLDAVLTTHSGTRRRSGRHGVYEVYVDIFDVARDAEGIERVRAVLVEVIQSMERP